MLKGYCRNHPHDGAEDEEPNCEERGIHALLLSLLMSAFPVSVENDESAEHRDASQSEQEDLWPGLLVWSPCREVVSCW
jgi:hypothetical protein